MWTAPSGHCSLRDQTGSTHLSLCVCALLFCHAFILPCQRQGLQQRDTDTNTLWILEERNSRVRVRLALGSVGSVGLPTQGGRGLRASPIHRGAKHNALVHLWFKFLRQGLLLPRLASSSPEDSDVFFLLPPALFFKAEPISHHLLHAAGRTTGFVCVRQALYRASDISRHKGGYFLADISLCWKCEPSSAGRFFWPPLGLVTWPLGKRSWSSATPFYASVLAWESCGSTCPHL